MRWLSGETKYKSVISGSAISPPPPHFYVTLGEEANFGVMEQRYLWELHLVGSTVCTCRSAHVNTFTHVHLHRCTFSKKLRHAMHCRELSNCALVSVYALSPPPVCVHMC